MGGTGLTKTMAKGFKSFRKYSLGDNAARAIEGDKLHDKMHFISTGVIKNADAIDAAEKSAKNDKAMQEAIMARQQEELANLNDEENARIKKMLVGGRYGLRGYRGSPLFRMAPSNTAGRGGAGGYSGGGTAVSGGGSQAAYGRTGGLLRGGFRTVQQ